MQHNTVRFGLVGYGLFGKHHAAAIASAEGGSLAAVCAPSSASQGAATAAHPGAFVCADYRQLIRRDDIDVVDVAAPNHLHYEIAVAALNADKHVFLEKPMALCVRELDELVAVAAARRRLLAINHELRLSRLWGGVKELIDRGVIGTPRYALVELSRFPYRQGADGWRYDTARVGSWILEEPIHFFDLACWYLASCGVPESIDAAASARDGRHELERSDNFSALVRWKNGAYAVVSQTLAAFGHHVTAKVAGEKGTIWARWSAPDARSSAPQFELRYGLGDVVQEVAFAAVTGELVELADHVAAIIQCVKHAESPPCSAVDGRLSSLLCLAALESARRCAPVALEDFAAAGGPAAP